MGERSGDPVPLEVRRPDTGCGEQEDEQDGGENRCSSSLVRRPGRRPWRRDRSPPCIASIATETSPHNSANGLSRPKKLP